ncbi:unnamed protein product [Adineta ricciae]|uniref:Uncharacterized protein n=1 Tax=Adineta ricciae TaxID=249248 RepID=A0A815RUL7_ADIRI|nr:unnamed protein product [Adineta ricciae]
MRNFSRTAKVTPTNADISAEYTVNGSLVNRGFIRRLNPMIFLTVGSGFAILVIIAALIVFTFLPIFSTAKGDQTKYQVRSDVLKLVYNLPDREMMSSINWTYEINDLDSDKLMILQNLLQDQLNLKRVTKRTSLVILDAYITHESSPSTTEMFVSPVTLDNNNNTIIIISQPDHNTQKNATTQLIISMRLRYALECAKQCQNDIRESVFARTFHSLEIPLNKFQLLFTADAKLSTNAIFSKSPLSVTPNPCPTVSPSINFSSTVIMARTYEAESLLNTFISTTIESCVVCSNQLKVSHIGFKNELIFQQIVSHYSGPVVIIFYYTTDRVRSAGMIVNEMLPATMVAFPVMSTNEDIASLPVTLNLCIGLNSIRIYNTYDYTPDFDRIIVY